MAQAVPVACICTIHEEFAAIRQAVSRGAVAAAHQTRRPAIETEAGFDPRRGRLPLPCLRLCIKCDRLLADLGFHPWPNG